MSVQYCHNHMDQGFRFRDRLTGRGFCLSANGQEDPNCLLHFSGSIAVALYRFQPRPHAQVPVSLKERVLTIDHDNRLAPRPPLERILPLQRETVSDIQAFGYDRNDPGQRLPDAVWCLVRQDLCLDNQSEPFLIVHWKHTLDSINLIDVIPGDRTELISE
jgi:hypothetical protein